MGILYCIHNHYNIDNNGYKEGSQNSRFSREKIITCLAETIKIILTVNMNIKLMYIYMVQNLSRVYFNSSCYKWIAIQTACT